MDLEQRVAALEAEVAALRERQNAKCDDLLVHREVDRLLRYPRGRSLRMARNGLLPCVRLPDGEIRFRESDVAAALDHPTDCITRDVLNDAFRLACERIADGPQKHEEANTAVGWMAVFVEAAKAEAKAK